MATVLTPVDGADVSLVLVLLRLDSMVVLVLCPSLVSMGTAVSDGTGGGVDTLVGSSGESDGLPLSLGLGGAIYSFL